MVRLGREVVEGVVSSCVDESVMGVSRVSREMGVSGVVGVRREVGGVVVVGVMVSDGGEVAVDCEGSGADTCGITVSFLVSVMLSSRMMRSK